MLKHIAKGIPNNCIARKIVSLLNRYLSNINSIYRLKIRYRSPKIGGYSVGGSLQRKNAKKFSLYLRIANKEINRRKRAILLSKVSSTEIYY